MTDVPVRSQNFRLQRVRPRFALHTQSTVARFLFFLVAKLAVGQPTTSTRKGIPSTSTVASKPTKLFHPGQAKPLPMRPLVVVDKKPRFLSLPISGDRRALLEVSVPQRLGAMHPTGVKDAQWSYLLCDRLNRLVMALPHVFVGCETGILKGILLPKGTFTNITTDPSNLVSKDRAIDSFFPESGGSDGSAEHSPAFKLRLCLRNRDVVCLNVSDPNEDFARLHVEGGEGKFVGGGMVGRNMITCVESGEIFVSEGMQRSKKLAYAEKDVVKMVHSSSSPSIFATGGRENHLKVWDVSAPDQPLFTAKNLPDDKLRLRVPTWINDIKFRLKTDSKILLTATAYHSIQVYDTRTQRRPVMTVNYGEDPLTCLDVNPEREMEVLVANRNGKVALFDLRGTKGIQLRAYIGNQGTVKDAKFHPSDPDRFATCGLARFLRIYSVKQKSPVSEVYLKSLPTCFSFTSEPVRTWTSDADEKAPAKSVPKKKKQLTESNPESDAIWEEMAELDDRVVKRNEPPKKKRIRR